MAIISQQENFLLKFRQENTQAGMKPVDVSVSKEDDTYLIELKADKKNTSIKLDLESLREILTYIDSKIYVRQTGRQLSMPSQAAIPIKGSEANVADYTALIAGMNGPSAFEMPVSSENVGGLSDLINDMSAPKSNSLYNSQADLIIANGIDISSLEK